MSHRRFFRFSRFAAVAAAGLSAPLVAGCHAYVEPAEPVAYTEVTAAPVGIEEQPSVIYEGHPVYYYGDRWWYREPRGHWAYYHGEPEELRRHRVTVRGAPVVEPRRERGRVEVRRGEGRPVEARPAERPPVIAH